MRLIRSKINAYLDETEEQRKGERERAQPILFSRKIAGFSVAHTIESSHIAKRAEPRRSKEGKRGISRGQDKYYRDFFAFGEISRGRRTNRKREVRRGLARRRFVFIISEYTALCNP